MHKAQVYTDNKPELYTETVKQNSAWPLELE